MTLSRFEGARFSLGQIVMTRAVADRVAVDARFAEFVYSSLRRHAAGDWGNLCDDDRRENEEALKTGERLFSSYGGEQTIWIVTEWNRTDTTIMFPEDY